MANDTYRDGYRFTSSDDEEEDEKQMSNSNALPPVQTKNNVQSGQQNYGSQPVPIQTTNKQKYVDDDDHKYSGHHNFNDNQQHQKPRYPPQPTQGKATPAQPQQTPTSYGFRSDQNFQNENDSDFPVIPLFHAKLKSEPFNPWDPGNDNDKRMYCVLNKAGGLGIGNHKPKIVSGASGNNRGYSHHHNRGRGGRGRGRGHFGGNKCHLCGSSGHIARDCRATSHGHRQRNYEQHQIEY